MTDRRNFNFRDTVAPFLQLGWKKEAMLPGKPGEKHPGRWLDRKQEWTDLKGTGLLTDGLRCAKVPTTWEQIQDWPTDTVCIRGAMYTAVDYDIPDPDLAEQVRRLAGPFSCERRSEELGHFLVPYDGCHEEKCPPPLRFTAPDGRKGMIEFNGRGKQWLGCGSPARKALEGRRTPYYWWYDGKRQERPPEAATGLPAAPSLWEEWRRHETLLRGAGFTVEPLGKVTKGGGLSEAVDPSSLNPSISADLLRRILEKVPATLVPPGGNNLSVYSAMSAAMGNDWHEVADEVRAWGYDYDGNQGWVDTVIEKVTHEAVCGPRYLAKWLRDVGHADLASAVTREIKQARGEGAAALFDEVDVDEGEAPAARPDGARANVRGVCETLMGAEEWRGVFGFCEFRQRVVVRKPVPGSPNRGAFRPTTLADHHEVATLVQLQGNGMPRAKIGDVCAAINLVARSQPFHPVRDYLNGLQWDGTRRLHRWLVDLFHAVPTVDDADRGVTFSAWVAAIGRAWMIGAVARVMDPGCKMDNVLVLEGDEGLMKSAGLRALCFDPAWFKDDLHKDLADVRAKSGLLGKWIVEMAELATLSRTEVEHAKAFITTAVDNFRGAWVRNEQDIPRQCVFAGTTNKTDWNKSDTGNRRFWPVRIGSKIVENHVAAARDQLWAEAVAAYRAGEQWWLTDELAQAASAEQRSRLDVDAWEATVLERVTAEPDVVVTIPAVLEMLGVPQERMDRTAQLRVSSILNRNGFRNTQGRFPWAANPLRFWLRPDGTRGTREAFKGGAYFPDENDTDDPVLGSRH